MGSGGFEKLISDPSYVTGLLRLYKLLRHVKLLFIGPHQAERIT